MARFTYADAQLFRDGVELVFGTDSDLSFQYTAGTDTVDVSAAGSAKMNWGSVDHITEVAVGTKNGATVAAVEKGSGLVHQTVLTCTQTPISVVGAAGDGFGGVKIYTFPEGRILVLGVTASLEVDDLDSNLDDTADGGDYGIGTAIVSDADLGDATDVDLCPSTSIDPIGTAVGAALAASAHFDGTSAAKTVNINLLIDDADIGGTEDVGMTGTVTLTWVNLGDY
jgi:hypothetical protein